ncbi:Hypothetical protein D9617_2g057880 [Elsinoe fawcettii]|nr:Hypothetical protein D9617_2g057880 [Elsinoe fawcettii]
MATLQEMRQDDSLWWRVLVFLHDLRHFNEKDDSQARLDLIVDPSYSGQPYFSNEEVSRLTTTKLVNGKTISEIVQETLNVRLERRMKKRVERSDYRICAAHDLAPVFEKAFDVNPKDLARNVKFIELVDKHGLTTPDDWRSVFAKVNRCGPKPRPGKKKPC